MIWKTCKDCDFYVGNKHEGMCTNSDLEEFETFREAKQELCKAIKEYIQSDEMQDYFRDRDKNK